MAKTKNSRTSYGYYWKTPASPTPFAWAVVTTARNCPRRKGGKCVTAFPELPGMENKECTYETCTLRIAEMFTLADEEVESCESYKNADELCEAWGENALLEKFIVAKCPDLDWAELTDPATYEEDSYVQSLNSKW